MRATVGTVLATLVAAPGVAAAAQHGLLAVAALAYREPRPQRVPPTRFLVVVPAHNEEAVLGGTLAAIARDLRARDQVLVVADRCSDATAAIARDHGAQVVERALDEPPGRAQARQAGVRAALALQWDALVMIDADSRIQPGFFDACERMLGTGALALQARSEAEEAPDHLVGQLSLAAFAIQGVTAPRGRDRLGLWVRPRGTGMVLARRLVERYRFHAPASEDLFYGLDLCLDGILPRHVDSARLRSASVRSWRAVRDQRTRYEAGRMAAARTYLGPLLRRRRLACLEAAWHLATPPFAVAAAILLVAAALAAATGTTTVVVVAAAALAVLAASLAVALVQAGVGARTWLALLCAPWYLPWKCAVQVRAAARVGRRQTSYAATPRH
jgi:hypothetical protein